MRLVPADDGGPRLRPGLRRKVAEGFADHMQRKVYGTEELLISLTNTLKLHEHAARTAQSPLGRIVELFAKRTDPDNLKIDGMRLHQLFELAGSMPPLEIAVGASYIIDLPSFRDLLSAVECKVNADRP